MTTFAKAMESNGHTNTSVSYLKVDVESSEINSIPEWLQTGALNNVQQIGIEMHTGMLTEKTFCFAFSPTMNFKYTLFLYDRTSQF